MEQILNKILSKLDTIESNVKDLKDGQIKLESNVKDLKDGQIRIESKIDSIYDQTADLTEFRTETQQNLTSVSQDIKFVKHKVQETEEDVFTIQSHLKIIK